MMMSQNENSQMSQEGRGDLGGRHSGSESGATPRDDEGETSRGSPACRSATFLATTPGRQEEEEIPADEAWRHVRFQKIKQPSREELLAETVRKLEQQVSFLTAQQRSVERIGTFNGQNFLESSIVNQARKRLKFEAKDVCSSIDSWNHFFNLYGVTSDVEKFFAVEQLLPAYIQRALSTNEGTVTSYVWLEAYLREKFEPHFLCHEMCLKTVSKNTNMSELEHQAMEAASCPKEQLVKHFMLQACSEPQRQKMKSYLLLPLRDFKFKMTMMVQEDTGRRYGGSNNFQNNQRYNQGKPYYNQSQQINAMMPELAITNPDQAPSFPRSDETRYYAQGNGQA